MTDLGTPGVSLNDVAKVMSTPSNLASEFLDQSFDGSDGTATLHVRQTPGVDGDYAHPKAFFRAVAPASDVVSVVRTGATFSFVDNSTTTKPLEAASDLSRGIHPHGHEIFATRRTEAVRPSLESSRRAREDRGDGETNEDRRRTPLGRKANSENRAQW